MKFLPIYQMNGYFEIDNPFLTISLQASKISKNYFFIIGLKSLHCVLGIQIKSLNMQSKHLKIFDAIFILIHPLLTKHDGIFVVLPYYYYTEECSMRTVQIRYK